MLVVRKEKNSHSTLQILIALVQRLAKVYKPLTFFHILSSFSQKLLCLLEFYLVHPYIVVQDCETGENNSQTKCGVHLDASSESVPLLASVTAASELD